ncbi:dTDP-4-dehydrorhamnose reductase [Moraxella lacunata]|uniref:dTDP-4-dehydrorhamnose reductase n=1 Tax=Moraxella lacunata TaxID=477 RepID=A0A378TSR8_MORLA|nr:dTDP-4-dehydrorhamnose reductase [Moraxella lacunata]STZ62912.1 dTDP-4-dehydrorhamnose reductase [Moraxella lacunata]
MKKIVVLAPTGQVGFELVRALSPIGEVVAIGRKEVDFSNLDELSERLLAIKPDVIVNAAAYTAVDKAESEPEQAFLINEKLPLTLATIVHKQNALLVHYSSDYVYKGDGEKFWQEDDPVAPLSVYGQSKLAGDNAIIENCQNYLIFRTSWVYAARGHNFMKTMIKLAQSKESLSVVNDQIGSPTPARLIADVSAIAIVKMLASQNKAKLSGVYHLAPQGTTSWYGYADEIFRVARNAGVDLALKDENFHGIPTESYPTPAKRPKNSRLNVSKLEQTFDLTMPTWQNQLQLTFDEWYFYQF